MDFKGSETVTTAVLSRAARFVPLTLLVVAVDCAGKPPIPFTTRSVSEDSRSPTTLQHKRPARIAAGGRSEAGCSNCDIREELLLMGRRDQEVRIRAIEASDSGPIHLEMVELDAAHVERLRAIIRAQGWPGTSQVGPDAADAAWLIAQHGDAQFLREVLPLMERAVTTGDLPPSQLALSVDRLRILDGRKQLYGSQLTLKGGKCELLPVEDPSGVDDRRKHVGLEPLQEYRARLCRLHERRSRPPESSPRRAIPLPPH